jgi:hypothetical protein
MHFQDQVTDLEVDRGPAWPPGSAPPSPVQAEALPMPANYGLGPDDDERLAPSRPNAR